MAALRRAETACTRDGVTPRHRLVVEAACWLLIGSVLVQQPLFQVNIAGSVLLVRLWDIAWLFFLAATGPAVLADLNRLDFRRFSTPVRAFGLYVGFVILSLTWVVATFHADGLVASVVRASRFVLIAYAVVMLPHCLNRAGLRRVVIVAALAGLVGGIEALYVFYHDTKVIQTATGPAELGITRPGGPFGNYFADGTADHWWVQSSASTNLGFWLGAAGAILLSIAAASWQRRRRPIAFGACLGAGLAFFALVATGSREAWVGGFLILALLAVLFGRDLTYRSWLLAILGLASALALIVVSVPAVRNRAADTLTPGTFSFRTGPQARVHAWIDGLQIGAERFPIGWGIGGVEEHADRFGRATAENVLIQVWMQTGAIGIILFLGWFVSALGTAASALRTHRHDVLAVFPGVVLLLLFAHGMFGYPIGDPTIQVLLAIALASLSALSPIQGDRT